VPLKDGQASLIPVGEDIQTFSVDEDISWVLIVEKDVAASSPEVTAGC